jgi:hypothetical protein
VDQIGSGASPQPDKEIAVPSTIPLVVAGWAVDPSEALAGGVEVAIDDKPYVATYGQERTDVATALKNPGLTKSGFNLTLPAGQLPKGGHTVAVRILNKAKTGYFETPVFHVRIE